MKIRKNLLFVLTLAVIVSAGTGIKASANQISTNTSTNTNLTSSTLRNNDLIAQNHFNSLMANIHKKNNAKSISTVDEYINIQNISNDANKPIYKNTKYTKQEFLQKSNSVLTNSLAAPISIAQQNSWIKLTLEFDDAGTGKRDVYGFYQWLTPPILNLDDVVGLGHDSNTVFDFYSSSLDNYGDYKVNGTYYTYHSRMLPSTIASRDFETDGVAYKFKLGNTSYSGSSFAYPGDYEYGMIHVRATPGGSHSGPIVFTYGHEQVNVNLGMGFSFNGSGSISFKIGTYYDAFKVANTIHF